MCSAPSHNPAGWAAHAAHGFLAALEAGSPRPGCRQGWVLARTHFLACTRPPPRCVLTWWCGELCRPILAGHKRLRGARPHGLIGPDHLPTAPPSSTAHRGWRFNVGIWGDNWVHGRSLSGSVRPQSRCRKTLLPQHGPGGASEARGHSRCSEPSGGEVAGVFPPRHGAAKAFEGHLSAGCSSPTRIRGQEALRTTLRPALSCGNRLSAHLLRGFRLSLLDAIVWNEAGATRSCAASCVPSEDDDVPAGCEWAMRVLRAVGPGRARLHAAPRSPGPAGWAAPAGRVPSEVVCARLCGQMLGYTE